MQLSGFVEQFDAIGVNVVAISYDSHVKNKTFSDKQQLKFPLLSDHNNATIIGFNILNNDYKPGDRAFGIPHPGVVFLTPDDTIGLKRAVPSYRQRPEFAEILAAVKQYTQS